MTSSVNTPTTRRRPRNRLAAVAITAALALTCTSTAASSAHAHAGLRGPQQPELDVSPRPRQSSRQLPQHGNQRPRRPANVSRHNMPPRYAAGNALPALPPGHDGHRRLPEELTTVGHRRLSEEFTTVELAAGEELASPKERDLVKRGRGRNKQDNQSGGRGRSNKGTDGGNNDDRGTNNMDPPKGQKKMQKRQQQLAQMQQRGRGDSSSDESRKKKIKEENAKRKDENKKLKDKLMTQQQKKDKNKVKKQQQNNDNDKEKRQKKQKKKDKPKLKEGGKKDKDKDKNKPDRPNGKKPGQKDKKDKDKKDKPNKNDGKLEEDAPGRKPDKKPDGKKPGKKDRPNKKDKPNKNDGKNPDKTKPGKNPDKKPNSDKPDDNDKPGKDNDDSKQDKFDILLQNAGISPQEASNMSDKEKNKLLLMTDGKFNLGGYEPPKKEDKPKPNNNNSNNNSEGGGSFSSNLKPKPKPQPQPQPQPSSPNGGGLSGYFSSGTFDETVPAGEIDVEVVKPPKPTPRPTRRTPRPTKHPKNEIKPDDDVEVAKPPKPTPRPTKRPKNENKPDDNTNTQSENTQSTNGSTGGSGWNFVSSLTDTSTQLDGFESVSTLDWTMPPMDAWERSNTHTSEGGMSLTSGITSDTYYQAGGAPIYSNLTLTTDSSFEGGVLTFMIWAHQLMLPNEVFFVSVDGKVELPPMVTSNAAAGGIDGWMEYSVPVGRGERKVTWSHVYNPFGMQSLPPSDGEVGLWMDDVRYAPFTTTARKLDLSQLEMTNGRDGASWQVVDKNRVVASSSDMRREEGNADIQFVLHSQRGGMLKYRVQTSTTAPNDDFAILLNDIVSEAIFGEMFGFEYMLLAVPPGKQVVTLRHRKNPGQFGKSMLGSLGDVGTDGKTWLEDLSFEEN